MQVISYVDVRELFSVNGRHFSVKRKSLRDVFLMQLDMNFRVTLIAVTFIRVLFACARCNEDDIFDFFNSVLQCLTRIQQEPREILYRDLDNHARTINSLLSVMIKMPKPENA